MEQHKPMVILITLKGLNYLLRSRLTKTSLGRRGLWKQITSGEALKQTTKGEEGKEVVVVDEGKWNQEDFMVLYILQSSLDGPIMEAYSYCETAKELWEPLQKLYGNTSDLSRYMNSRRQSIT